VLETLRNLGPTRLVVMAGIVAASVAFFFFITTRLTTPSMGLLYADLDQTDSGRIIAKLDAMKVPYELQGSGQIMVPNDQILKLRMQLAQEGLPTGGNMGYELFDRSETFGTSSFVLDIQHLRALEGEISRTIRSLNYVQNARVHLVMPKREAFAREPIEASASVLLQMVGGRRLSKTEVGAIQHLVASAVPKLKASRISIIDNQGTLLANGEGKDEKTTGADGDDMRVAYEARLTRSIEEMLERTVGPGRVRAEVTAAMDFDHISTTKETYDPDGQVVRSTQSVEDSSSSKDADQQTVTVAGNLPTTPGAAPQNNSGSGANKSNRTEETVNYEISKTVQTHVREGGNIQHLSVAVLVDGTYTDGPNKTRIYQPRSAEEMQSMTKLVQSAVGFNAERGDKVDVINLRFTQGDEPIEEPARPLFGLTKNDYMKIAELVVMGVVAILILLMVVRPLMKRVLESLPDAIASSKNLISESLAAAQNQGMLPSGGNSGIAGALGAPAGMTPESQIDLAQVEGRVRESTVKKVGEIVDKHPEEAVNIIRNWMYQQS
jgi:flagellar M-ring protein FliF